MLLVIGACGQTTEERAATGGLGGAVLDEGVDEKVDNTADETPDATTD
jgi:hypothetical protein